MNVKKIIATIIAIFGASLLFADTAFSQQYTLLIIAPYEFVDELQPLKNWKDETGRPTVIVSLGEIEERDYGDVRDQPEQIKRFIDDYVRNHQVQYVMLVGDSDKFPVRYIKAYNTEWGDKYYPSDLYYMDLYDGNGDFDNWDGDGDNIIGEIDFTGGTNIANVNLDDIDMYPDVAVARVPASTESEVSTYVNKIINYENLAPGTWFNNALLVVDGGTSPFGDETKMDGIAPYLSGFNIQKYYQDNPPYTTMTTNQRANEINSAINNGVGFVNYLGHGNRLLWAGWYDNQQMSALSNSNERLPIIMATACYTGRFHFDRDYYMDRSGFEWNGGSSNFPEPMPVQPSQYDSYNDESLAEHFLVKNATGAVAYIGNVSKCEHGAWLEPTQGLSPYFFEEYAAGERVLGKLWETAISQFADDLQNPVTGGMHFYAFIHIHKMMLFGDPSLAVGGLASTSSPTADIKANGSDGPIEVSSGDTVSLTVGLDTGSYAGQNGDWWLCAVTPNGFYSYVFPSGLVWGISPIIQFPIFNITSPLTLLNLPLPEGNYIFYFGIDNNPNGLIDIGSLWYDSVMVNVVSESEDNIGNLKDSEWERYVGETVTVEGIFVRDPLPILVTDLDVVKVNQPIPESRYIILVGNNAQEIDPAEFGGARLRLTGVVNAIDNMDQYMDEYVGIQVISYEILELVERYHPAIIDVEIRPEIREPGNYAVLFSGGIKPANNYVRYWNDLKFMYSALVNEYGYAPENIAVLYANGSGRDSQMPVHYSATQTSLETVFNLLKETTTENDFIFFFTTNHGGGFEKADIWQQYIYGGQLDGNSDEGTADILFESDYNLDLNGDGDKVDQVAWDEALFTWGDMIIDDAFNAMFENLEYDRMVVVMEQCFSGGLIADMARGGNNRIIMSAAGEYEPSWAMGPSYNYDEFSYHFTSAVNGSDSDGNTVNADTNSDGEVSMVEAFNYARSNDTASETPQYEDNGDGISHAGSIPAGNDGFLGSITSLH